ncbi:MAG: 4'-phosphopantetheinyl transferase superfamily protein [Brachybacterium sp.]|nr:4'-phosphopantetheinyl transferase superfamily protein [Brachybacterium sp.]
MTAARVWWSAPDPAAVHDPLLDDAERERCARYRLEADRARHATGRVMAKRVVAAQCGVEPEEVSVIPDPEPTEGRPRARVRRQGAEAPWISITHAGGVVGVALSARPCGLDVQDVDSITPLIGSDLVFGAAEQAELARLTGADRARTACAWWVAKEATLKALGLGLSESLPGVPGKGAVVRIDLRDGGRRLSRVVVPAPPGHLAGLAVEAEEAIDLQTFCSAPSRIR